jgi:hypothetical protein
MISDIMETEAFTGDLFPLLINSQRNQQHSLLLFRVALGGKIAVALKANRGKQNNFNISMNVSPEHIYYLFNLRGVHKELISRKINKFTSQTINTKIPTTNGCRISLRKAAAEKSILHAEIPNGSVLNGFLGRKFNLKLYNLLLSIESILGEQYSYYPNTVAHARGINTDKNLNFSAIPLMNCGMILSYDMNSQILTVSCLVEQIATEDIAAHNAEKIESLVAQYKLDLCDKVFVEEETGRRFLVIEV